MATNDLMTELQKDSIKLDDDSEKKVVQSVLKLVEDKNGEVQNLAVKWLVMLSVLLLGRCPEKSGLVMPVYFGISHIDWRTGLRLLLLVGGYIS